MPDRGNHLRLLLLTLLVLSSGSAYAEWVTVSEDKQEGKTAYVNPDAIRNGNLVKMWTLLDYKTTQMREGSLYMSEQAQHEFDCAEERFRILALAKYSGNMASGNVVYSRKPLVGCSFLDVDF